ncbi:hypothetical protein [Lacrimispora sp.]|nr:hypothetical protein [Lacrimispora sp.]
MVRYLPGIGVELFADTFIWLVFRWHIVKKSGGFYNLGMGKED